ncbi:MAG: hypothetical protein H0W72_13915, partial [Planctomycetes bacterium]|nr:hypothetical protein [Planctomycetota bacterium]
MGRIGTPFQELERPRSQCRCHGYRRWVVQVTGVWPAHLPIRRQRAGAKLLAIAARGQHVGVIGSEAPLDQRQGLLVEGDGALDVASSCAQPDQAVDRLHVRRSTVGEVLADRQDALLDRHRLVPALGQGVKRDLMVEHWDHALIVG